nr:hypothetical protein [Arthrobacter sp. SRS-W-1-2016]
MVLFLEDLHRRSPRHKSGGARRRLIQRRDQLRLGQRDGDPRLQPIAAVERPDASRRSRREPAGNNSPDRLRVTDRIFTTEIAKDLIPPTNTDGILVIRVIGFGHEFHLNVFSFAAPPDGGRRLTGAERGLDRLAVRVLAHDFNVRPFRPASDTRYSPRLLE